MKKIIIFLAISGLILGGLVLAEKTEKKEMSQTEKLSSSVTPEPEIILSKPKEKLEGEIEIKIRVPGAESIELELKRGNSPVSIYLGQAQKETKDIWKLKIDTRNLPNDNYKFILKITNPYGQYLSKEIEIKIENEIKGEPEKEKELKEKVEKGQERIEKAEKEITEKKEETKEVIESTETQSKEEVQETVESIVEKTKEGEKLGKEISKKEMELKETETEINQAQKELKELPKEVLSEIKKEKEEKVTELLEKKKETEKEKITKEGKLKEIKEESEKLKKELGEKNQQIVKELEETVSAKEKEKIEILEEISKDSDDDGIPDYEEIKIGTDSYLADTDGDGFLDGAEISAGYDPLKPGVADKIVYQDPKNVKPKETDKYKVERVEIVILPTAQTGLKISGKALPNSFVTIYVFSLPITVTILRADADGNWEYVLDKPLTDGQHTVYAALTNNSGEIQARSEAFVFMKTGPQVFRILETPQVEASLSLKALQKSFAVLIAGIIALGIGIALIIVGILVKREEKTAP